MFSGALVEYGEGVACIFVAIFSFAAYLFFPDRCLNLRKVFAIFGPESSCQSLDGWI